MKKTNGDILGKENKKPLFLSLFVFLLILSLFSFLGVSSAYANSDVDVGAYYYGWYHGGYNSHGWNESFHDESLKDKPFLGYYNNWNDTFTMKQHIAWADDLGIDFLLTSWSAYTHDGIDDNAKTMFKVRRTFGNVKLALCVEPFNQTESPETYNWTWIHNQIYENYCNYSFYYELDDRPLVAYIMGNGLGNMTTVTQENDTFTQIGIGGDEGGGRSNGDFPSWIKMWAYTSLTPERPYKDPPYSDRCYVVCPRYDDVACRRRNLTVGEDYKDYNDYKSYTEQWQEAREFARKDDIDVIMICTFNEYMERTFIEPCFDHTSFSDNPFYIINLTKHQISELRHPSDTTAPNITQVSQSPAKDNVKPEDPVRVNATITDYGSGVKKATLNYTSGNGTWIACDMANLEGNIYNATIPAFDYGTYVNYTILAEDKSGNTISTTQKLGYDYQYPVIPEFPSTIILPLFMTGTLLTAILHKRNQRENHKNSKSFSPIDFQTSSSFIDLKEELLLEPPIAMSNNTKKS